MTEPSKAVFLSYASQDAESARRICEALQAAGVEVWFDQSDLRGGDVWDHQIRKQIHDCALFIPIISTHTQTRTEGYFRLEWHLADQRRLLMTKSRPFLVPVAIDSTPEVGAEVPDSFAAVQWTRIPQGETPAAFVTRISQLLASRDLQASAQPEPSSGSVASFRPRAASVAPLRRARLPSLLIAAAALTAAGYVAVDKFVLSKRTATLSIAALPGESAAGEISEKSIAVLPFADMSEKKDQEYFSDGLAEELLDLLAKTPGLHVIARVSSFSFKGKSDDIPTIARKLHVANILEGSVRKSGERLRVTTKLIRASNSEPLWSETYDRELKDVFAVQDEIASAVVGQLQLKLASMPQSAVHRTSNLEAYNQYLLGREFLNRGNLDGYERAIAAYRRSIAIDPSYVAPYGGLAIAEYFVADDTADAAGYRRAAAAAEKAVELGPEDANAYTARGFIRHNLTWDWAGAQADFEKAIALDPGDAQSQHRYGGLLASLGRLPEAIAVAKKAVELDPLRSAEWERLVFYLSSTRDFRAADEASRRALEISPNSSFALKDFVALQLLEGKAQDALATSRRIGEGPWRLSGIAMAEHTLNDAKASQHALDELIAKHAAESAYQIAEIYAWRGEPDKAFEWLERAYIQRDAGLTSIKFDPLIDSLRGDSRYQTLLTKMHLPK